MMKRLLALTSLAAVLALAGCPANQTAGTGDGTTAGNTNTDNTPDDTDTTDAGDDDSSTSLSLSGVINASESAKRAAIAEGTDSTGYVVLMQSTETQETYSALTDASGAFLVDLPAEEQGNLFMVTVIGPDSQALGPVVFGDDGTNGYTGLELNGAADLGTFDAPDAPGDAPLAPGPDADLDNADVPDDVVSRLDDNGVPVGVTSHGKGDGAQGDASDDPRQQLDSDQDGLIDTYDADDDGDGTVDDFDPDAVLSPIPFEGVTLSFFMNLKIESNLAQVFYAGDEPGIEEILKNNTVITFELKNNSSSRNVTAVRLIGPPAPTPIYQPDMTVLHTGALWSDTAYAFDNPGPNHFQAFATPHQFMNAGDTFTVEVSYDDGTVGVYSRMINFVFKSIPKLVNAGAPGALTPVAGPETIAFDGTQDLELEWNPPVDDTGALLTGLPYRFEVFFHAADGSQINGIDGAATWPTPPAGFSIYSTSYEPSTPFSTLSADNTFTVTLPNAIFVDTVQTTSGPVAVDHYVIDIAAQNNGNNAALKMSFKKQ